MKTILLHGLGQTSSSWTNVRKILDQDGIDILCPDLYSLPETSNIRYEELYHAFESYCSALEGPLNLCGLSLGGLLALDYAKKHPDRIRSLVIMGVPYQIPKALFALQSMLFHLLPKKAFASAGLKKAQIIDLVQSMQDLDIPAELNRISAPCLILCGEQDRPNQKYMEDFHHGIKNSRCEIIGNSSHEINGDNPEKLARILSAFLHDPCSFLS